MADDEDGAVIIGDHLLQQVERFEVEIVGRLVEHEQVRAPGEFAREQQPRALAARKGADLRIDQVRDRTGIPSDSPGRASCRRAPRSSRRRRRGCRARVLSGSSSLRCWSIMMPCSVLARAIRAVVGRDLAGQQLEQGGLAGAVGADHADPVAALDAQREVADDRAGRRNRFVTRSASITIFVFTSSFARPSFAAPGRAEHRRPHARASRAAWRAGPGCGGGGR